MPFAIVQTGGKQHRVEPGQIIDVEKLPVREGDTVELTEVLLVSNEDGIQHGTPKIDGARVVATVLKQDRAAKVIVFKYKPKVRYRRKIGHRQAVTRLAITQILTAKSTSRAEENGNSAAETQSSAEEIVSPVAEEVSTENGA